MSQRVEYFQKKLENDVSLNEVNNSINVIQKTLTGLGIGFVEGVFSLLLLASQNLCEKVTEDEFIEISGYAFALVRRDKELAEVINRYNSGKWERN